MSPDRRRADRRQDFFEANVQICAGFILSGTVTWLIFDLEPLELLGVNSIYFVVSYTRQITVRSIFRARERRKLKE